MTCMDALISRAHGCAGANDVHGCTNIAGSMAAQERVNAMSVKFVEAGAEIYKEI
jgi:hypothetical protein